MKRMKQMTAMLLATAMFLAGLMIIPMSTKAAETVVNSEKGIIFVCDEESYNFTSLWKDRKAPTRAGYVFGGWYAKKQDDSFVAIKESEGSDITDNTKVYAKFVPAEVLSVRAQLDITTEENNGASDSTYLRLLSAVNGLDYQKVGFDIYYNKKHHETDAKATNITKVFEKITNAETGNEEITADCIFGEAATHFSVLRLQKIQKANYEYVIYVTPTWTTLDGTTVEGQAKYVRVMDGYASNHYISVPVNFLSESEVAAGMIEMTYDTGLEVVGFEPGILMNEGQYYDDQNGTVKIVANTDGVKNKSVVLNKEIYANVWFKVKEGTDTATGTEWKFNMKNFSFCNWNESWVNDLTAWDVTYRK